MHARFQPRGEEVDARFAQILRRATEASQKLRDWRNRILGLDALGARAGVAHAADAHEARTRARPAERGGGERDGGDERDGDEMAAAHGSAAHGSTRPSGPRRVARCLAKSARCSSGGAGGESASTAATSDQRSRSFASMPP